MSTRVNVYKPTDDDWYDSYQISNAGAETMLVQVSFTQTGPSPPIKGDWRVCVWGNDDCGMEMDFQSESVAWNMFLQVIGLSRVNRGGLKQYGFISV